MNSSVSPEKRSDENTDREDADFRKETPTKMTIESVRPLEGTEELGEECPYPGCPVCPGSGGVKTKRKT